jgi:hypothetical protein
LQDHDAFNAHENEISGRQNQVTAMPRYALSFATTKLMGDLCELPRMKRLGLSTASSLALSASRWALRSCVRCVNHDVANEVSPPIRAALQRVHRRGRPPLWRRTKPSDKRCDRNGPALHHGRAYAPGFRPVRGQCRRAGRGPARRDLPRANRTLREALEYAHKGGMGFLTEFGEAARIDLAARATAVR